jgi:flagellar protein FliO/FliZ
MNTLFGVELPTSVTFIIAFVVVLVLIGAAAWVVRKFGAGRLAAGRGRQPRLAVIDAAAVDSRRKLIIIRRDNVEHLLMIGGPSDVVVETNILRAAPAAQREAPAVRAPTEAASLRATPLSDAPPWPPQTEPVAAPPRADRPRLLPEESAPAPMSIPMTIPPQPAPAIMPPLRVVAEPARPQASADPLMGLAAELSRSKIEPIARPPEPPRVVIPLAPAHSDSDSPIMPAPPSVAASAAVSPDVHLAEMAQRLETALRRPLAQKREESKRAEKSAPIVNPPTNGGAPNGATAKTAYADLEQEMASLLGRQPGKT